MYPTDWSTFITTSDAAVTFIPESLVESSGRISVSYSFSQTIQGKQMVFDVNPVGMVNSTYLSTVSTSTLLLAVQPSNNIAAVYCDDAICKLRTSTAAYTTFQSTVAYIGLACSLLSLKIAGL